MDNVDRSPFDIPLFEHDWLNRVLRHLRMPFGRKRGTVYRIIFFFTLTWLPVLILALLQHVATGPAFKDGFLYDIAAHVQFLIAIPLFLAAEPFIDRQLQEASRHFHASRIVRPSQSDAYLKILNATKRLSGRSWPEILILVAQPFLSWIWLSEEFTNGISTWHAPIINAVETPTFAGLWLGCISVPLYQFFLWRWGWKVILWISFLFRVSRLDLRVQALHPDKTGGLGFLSLTQGAFGILVFATGAVIAASAGHHVWISGQETATFSVWGALLAYIVLAPLLFLLPLMFFTAKLFRAKEETEHRYAIFAGNVIQDFETRWLAKEEEAEGMPLGHPDIQSFWALLGVQDTLHHMRIVPFDLKTASQLVLSAVTPVLPIASRLIGGSSFWNAIVHFFASGH